MKKRSLPKLPKLPRPQLDPLTARRLRRFRSLKRGYGSFLLLLALLLFSLCAELFINSRALAVWYGGRLYLPTYTAVKPGTTFGYEYPWETDYRQLQKDLHASGRGWVLMPLVPYDPLEQEFRDDGTFPPYPPDFTRRHFLGTDRIGRDIAARLVYGFRIAILFSLIYVTAVYLIGTLVGTLMGYWGGWFDIIFQRLIEIWQQLPFLYVVMILVSIFRPDFFLFLFIFILFDWTGKTWQVRAMTYRERERDYILAARATGASFLRIIIVHIIPNILVVVLTTLPFTVLAGIASLTALDYLGLGLAPPTPSWGELIQQGLATYRNAPWILTSVVSAMVVVLVMIAFIGEALRDAFDPKQYTVYK